MRTVQKILGHARLSTTERYLSVLPDVLASAGERLEAFRASAGAPVTSALLAPSPRRKGARKRPEDT